MIAITNPIVPASGPEDEEPELPSSGPEDEESSYMLDEDDYFDEEGNRVDPPSSPSAARPVAAGAALFPFRIRPAPPSPTGSEGF